MQITITVTGDAEAALGAIAAQDGYPDPPTWISSYVTQRLRVHMEDQAKQQATADYYAAVDQAKSDMDAAVQSAQAAAGAAIGGSVTAQVSTEPLVTDPPVVQG